MPTGGAWPESNGNLEWLADIAEHTVLSLLAFQVPGSLGFPSPSLTTLSLSP